MTTPTPIVAPTKGNWTEQKAKLKEKFSTKDELAAIIAAL